MHLNKKYIILLFSFVLLLFPTRFLGVDHGEGFQLSINPTSVPDSFGVYYSPLRILWTNNVLYCIDHGASFFEGYIYKIDESNSLFDTSSCSQPYDDLCMIAAIASVTSSESARVGAFRYVINNSPTNVRTYNEVYANGSVISSLLEQARNFSFGSSDNQSGLNLSIIEEPYIANYKSSMNNTMIIESSEELATISINTNARIVNNPISTKSVSGGSYKYTLVINPNGNKNVTISGKTRKKNIVTAVGIYSLENGAQGYQRVVGLNESLGGAKEAELEVTLKLRACDEGYAEEDGNWAYYYYNDKGYYSTDPDSGFEEGDPYSNVCFPCQERDLGDAAEIDNVCGDGNDGKINESTICSILGAYQARNIYRVTGNDYCNVYCKDSVKYTFMGQAEAKAGRFFSFDLKNEDLGFYGIGTIATVTTTCVSLIDNYSWINYGTGNEDIIKNCNLLAGTDYYNVVIDSNYKNESLKNDKELEITYDEANTDGLYNGVEKYNITTDFETSGISNINRYVIKGSTTQESIWKRYASYCGGTSHSVCNNDTSFIINKATKNDISYNNGLVMITYDVSKYYHQATTFFNQIYSGNIYPSNKNDIEPADISNWKELKDRKNKNTTFVYPVSKNTATGTYGVKVNLYTSLVEKKNGDPYTYSCTYKVVNDMTNFTCKDPYDGSIDNCTSDTRQGDDSLGFYFRTIDLVNVFPKSEYDNSLDNNLDAVTRDVGKNWKSNDAETVINNIQDLGTSIWTEEPMYSVTLTAEDIIKIKEYNNTKEDTCNGQNDCGYLDNSLTCRTINSGLQNTIECESNFLKDSNLVSDFTKNNNSFNQTNGLYEFHFE